MAGKTIDVLFGVKGGGSISGESGALILSQLKGIVSDIEAQGVTTLKFQVDTSALKASKLSAEEAKEAIENLKVEQQAAKTVEQKLKTAISETRLEREKQTNELKKEQAAAKAAAAAKKEEEAAARKAAKAAADEAKAKEKAEKQKIKEQNNDYSIASKNYKKYAQLNSMLQKNEKAIKKAGYWDEGLTLLGQFKEADFKNVREAESAFDTYRKKLVDAGVETDTFGKKISRLFNEHFNTALAMAGVHALQQALYGIYQNVVDIDKAVTDLQVATGGTRDSARELVAEYSEMAMELGATTVEVASAADTWLRQGKTVEEANQLIRQSMILSKLGQIESAEASTALTSALNGYKLEAEDAANVVDKLVAVDMEAAASSGGLAVSMSETANSARIAGIDMDKLIGQMAVVKEVTQESDEVVGNFFKTLYSRMGNVKAGRLMDPETGESLSDVETTLSGLGIQLRDSDSEFRNFGDVLDEVGAKWDSFSSVQQRAVAVAFSGTRQQERFLSLMENYDRSLELMDVAANSAGVGEQRFADAYLTSIEAAQNRFTASFEKLSTSVLDGGIVTGLMDIASALMSVLTPLASIVGVADGLPIKIAAVVAAFWALHKVWGGIKKLNLISSITNLNVQGFGGTLTIIPRVIASFVKFAVQTRSVTAAINEMKVAMAASNISPVMLGIQAAVLVIGGLVWAIDSCITTTEEYREQLKETAQEYQNLKTESDNLNSELETTKDRIAELQELADKGTISITEEAELTRLQQQNAELERQIALLDEKKKRETEDAQKEFIGGVEKEIDLHPVDRVEEAVGQGETYGNLSFVGYDFEDIDNVLRLQKYYSEILDEQENKNISLQNSLEENQEVIEKFADANNEALQNLYDAGYLYGMNEEVDAYIDKINEFNDAYLLFTGNSDGLFNQILNRPQFEEANKALTELGENGEATAENLQSLYNSNSNFKEFIDYIASIPGYIDWESIIGEDAFEEAAGDDGFLNQKEAEALAGEHLAEVLGLVANEFKNTQEAEEDATNAIPKFISNMKMTEDQLKQINGEADGPLAKFTNQLNELAAAYEKVANGNVSLGSRPIISGDALNAAGYDTVNGTVYIDYSTYKPLSTNVVGVEKEFGITITPVLEDGSILAENELNDYLKELESSIQNDWTKEDILEWDVQRKGLIIDISAGIKEDPDLENDLQKLRDKYLGIAKATSASIAADGAKEVQGAAEMLSGIVKDIDETGRVSNDNLLSIFDQFGDVPELYKYIEVLTDASSTSGQLKQALQELYTAYIAQSGLLGNINELNKDQVVTQLELLGVTNAEQVANWALTSSYSDLYDHFLDVQSGMSTALSDSVRARLETLDIELTGIKSVSDAYSSMENFVVNKMKTDRNFVTSDWIQTFKDLSTQYDENGNVVVSGSDIYDQMIAFGELSGELEEARQKLDDLQANMPDIDLNIPDFSSDSQDSKTPGELALERWREYYDNLKHLREMDQITDAQYYQALEQNYRNYLGNYEETADTLRSVQEELHKHEKEVIQNQWDEYYDSLKHMREMDLLTDRQYYTSLIANANNYLSKYEDMADTLKSIQEEVYSYLKDLYKEDLESQKDALEKKKDDLKDFYDRQKELLQDQYDEEDEQEKREDYAHEIAKLQLLISSLQRDTTQEAKRRLAEAEEELAQLQEEYDDWEKENARNDALDALDEQYESEAAKLDSQIEDIDNTIQSIDDGVGGIYNIVKAWAKKNGYDVSGLATGTNSAAGGLYRTQEQGAEMLGYNLGSGQFTYLTPQSKVWNAAATQVLYDFANSPLRFLSRYKGIMAGNVPQVRNVSLSFGDIVVNGKADASTVAALRKERTNIAYVVLEQLKKLK